MIDNLTFEIIIRIIADVGAVPNASFGKGLTDPSLMLEKTLSLKYDNNITKSHALFSGKLDLGDSTIRGLLIDLSIGKSCEFLFMFRMDAMPIHAVKVLYDDPPESFIKIYREETDSWIFPSMYMKAKMLSEFERIVAWGMLWDKCKETSDLYDVAKVLVETR